MMSSRGRSGSTSRSTDGHRLRPIRLSEVPLRIREDAYRRILMDEVTSEGAIALDC